MQLNEECNKQKRIVNSGNRRTSKKGHGEIAAEIRYNKAVCHNNELNAKTIRGNNLIEIKPKHLFYLV